MDKLFDLLFNLSSFFAVSFSNMFPSFSEQINEFPISKNKLNISYFNVLFI